MNLFAQIANPNHFEWTHPNWGWFFLGIALGNLVTVIIHRQKQPG